MARFDKLVKPHIWYWTTSTARLCADQIPEDVWDGKQNAHEHIKPRKSAEEVEMQQAQRERSVVMQMMVEDVD